MKAKLILFLLIVALSLVLIQEDTIAQDSTDLKTPRVKKQAWIEMGVGLGAKGFVYTISAQFQIKESALISFVYDGADNHGYDSDFELFGVPEDYTSAKSAGVLFGKLNRKPWGMITYSGGIAWVIASDHQFIETGSCGWFCSNYEKKINNTYSLGIPLDVKFILIKKPAGFVINPFINLNLAGSYGGLKVSVALGRIRSNP